MSYIQRMSLIILGAAYFIFGTGSLAVVGLTEPMASSFKVNESDIAQLITVFALAFALIAPVVQVVGNRISRKRLIVIGLLLVSVGLIGTGLAPNYSIAMFFRVLTAIGAAIVGPIASSLGASIAPPGQTAKALAIVFSGMTVATVIGVPLSSFLGHHMDWASVFVLLGLISLLVAIVVHYIIDDDSQAAPVKFFDLLNIARRPATSFAMGATLMQMAAQFATYALISVLLAERFSASAFNISLALMLFGLGGIVANFIVAKFGDLVSEESLLVSSLLFLGLVFIALIYIPENVFLAMLIVALWSLFATVFMVPQQKRLLKLAPEQSGLLLAVNASALYLGMSVGSAIGAYTWESFGNAALPVASLLLVAVSVFCHMTSVRAFKSESAKAQ